MNMSYCRFHNTLADLKDCEEALYNSEELTEDETKSAKRLLKICENISNDFTEEDINDMEEKCEDCKEPYRNDKCKCL